MDNGVLKKKLNTYKSSKGTLTQVGDEVVMDVLRAWENWPGKFVELYRELGISKMQLTSVIKKGKNLVKRGVVKESEFKELKLDSVVGNSPSGCGIELNWTDGKVIRFGQVELLIDFLKKVA
jgi:hypothetical protein